MRKPLFIVFLCCLVFLLFAGCGSAGQERPSAGSANADTKKLSEDQVVAWALGCSAIFAVSSGYDPNEFGMFKKNDMGVLQAKIALFQYWGCSDHDSLVNTINIMTDNGTSRDFADAYKFVSSLSDKELEALADSSREPDSYMWPLTKEIGDRWDFRQIKAWDWFRMIQIAGMGYIAGYLEREEAYSLMVPVIDRLRSTFSSWDEANDNYMDGFAWWSQTDLSNPLSSREYKARMRIYEDLKAYPPEISFFDPTLWPDYVPDGQDGANTAGDNLTKNYTYEDNGDGTCTITGYKWERGDIDIPGEIDGLKVTAIGDKAFYQAKGFDGVLTIPDTVESIGALAFLGCSGLTGDLTLPDSVTALGYQAFAECPGFTGNLTLSSGLKEIGRSAFASCYGFSGSLTIPEGVVTIGDSAFVRCSSLSGNLVFPESLITIDTSAFAGCAGLSGTVAIPRNLTDFSATSIFRGCPDISDIEVSGQNPEYMSADGILYSKDKSVIVYVPPGMKKSNFSIPEGTKEIGRNAFADCTGFVGTLTIPGSVTKIGLSAFAQCRRLDAITIPDSVTIIEADAFRNCSKLKTITIPGSVTSLYSGFFQDCSSLSEAVFLGNAPDKVPKSAFLNCASDFKIIYDPAKSGWSTPEWNGYPCYPK